jgi:hypothetical protein
MPLLAGFSFLSLDLRLAVSILYLLAFPLLAILLNNLYRHCTMLDSGIVGYVGWLLFVIVSYIVVIISSWLYFMNYIDWVYYVTMSLSILHSIVISCHSLLISISLDKPSFLFTMSPTDVTTLLITQ